ncbi:integrase family protein [Phenylobacterium sp. Root700]|uniref:integrase family protein n=1 Tax=Phenylobacterium sp. Root700 TaxID=1736591 RepID=UPI0009E97B81|nr:integrase family protein [Phenylobacterium sp. Root700]
MGDLRLPLTDKNVAGLPLAPGEQYLARDAELGGFFLLVGGRAKSFMIQADLRKGGVRRSIRMKVGDAEDVSCRDARARAKELLGQIARGHDPRPEKSGATSARPKGVPTLREAWARFRAGHLVRKARSPATLRHYGDHVERLLVDWLDLPLSVLGEEPRLVADRHDAISRENGPAIANGAMRSFRAIYNHARKTAPQLPHQNPAFAVDWNPEKRRDTALGVADLPAWFEQLAMIDNPVRREFHLMSLLSGCRPDALKHVRLQDLDLRTRSLRIPRPKGGEARAFDIPLSRAMLQTVFRLRRLAPILYPLGAEIWLFPSDAPSGHLEEHKEKRVVLSKWGNDLRQSYRTLGQAAGLSEVDMHLLMNHALPGVNAGYITRAKLMGDHLRAQQDKLSSFIIGTVVGRGRRPSPALSRWLNSTSRMQLEDLLLASPDEARALRGPRSALRKLEIQAARCQVQGLDERMLDAPSRRAARAA